MNSAEVLHDEIKVAAEIEGRKTTRVSGKSPGISQAANERDAKSMIFASPCHCMAFPSSGMKSESEHQATARWKASSGALN